MKKDQLSSAAFCMIKQHNITSLSLGLNSCITFFKLNFKVKYKYQAADLQQVNGDSRIKWKQMDRNITNCFWGRRVGGHQLHLIMLTKGKEMNKAGR